MGLQQIKFQKQNGYLYFQNKNCIFLFKTEKKSNQAIHFYCFSYTLFIGHSWKWSFSILKEGHLYRCFVCIWHFYFPATVVFHLTKITNVQLFVFLWWSSYILYTCWNKYVELFGSHWNKIVMKIFLLRCITQIPKKMD